jgi:hypothetical protein
LPRISCGFCIALVQRDSSFANHPLQNFSRKDRT